MIKVMCETHEIGWTVVATRVSGLRETRLYEVRMHPRIPPYPTDATSAIVGAMQEMHRLSFGGLLDTPEAVQPCGR